DGHLELLARAGVGDGRHGDDVVGNVPGRGLGPQLLPDPLAQTVVELDAVGQVDEEGHPVPAIRLFGADDQGVGNLGDAVDDVVDVGAAQADTVPVERGIGPARDDDAAAVG